MASTRYIAVPSDRLISLLEGVGTAIAGKGGKFVPGIMGREVVYDLFPRQTGAHVRVFTSLASGDATVRDCGEDAVRLVIGYIGPKGFAALGPSRRIYRTAPKGTANERVQAFLDRLRDALRTQYAWAREWPTCPSCGAPMAARTNRANQSQFAGCTRYPQCKMTQPVAVFGSLLAE